MPSPPYASSNPFTARPLATFDEPWAMAIDPGTGTIFVTEKKGTIKFLLPDGRVGTVSGVPNVAYGGQGGLGDIAVAPAPARQTLDRRTIYISWAQGDAGKARHAVVARGELACNAPLHCAITGLTQIWRQVPAIASEGHFGHRLAFSPDGQYLFVSSGERQQGRPAQDLATNLGKIVRLLPDGTPAPGNPFADKGGITAQIWSYGHRNPLGLQFDSSGRLWDLEHGPAGGDELNLVEPGRNYGWPIVSNGDDYSGRPIPRHSTRPDLAAPAISWNPVIAHGGFIFYSGKRFSDWKGEAVIAALGTQGLVRVAIDDTRAREVARYNMEARIRAVAERADGALLVLEDGEGGRLLELLPKAK